MYQPYKKKYQAYISNDGHDLMQKPMMLLLFLSKKVITEFMFWYISKRDENTKERLREQAQSKYIDSLTKKKIRKENIGEIDIKMSQEDK